MKLTPTKTQLEKAKEIVREGINKASHELGVETDPEIALGYTHDSFTIDTLGGVSGETFSNGKIDITFNPEPSGWKENLRRTVAHEYAHTQFFQHHPRQRDDPLWKVILGEAQSTNLAQKCFPEIEPPTINAVDKQKLKKYWPKVRERMDEELGWNNEILFSNFYNYDLPMYYGYSLAFRVGKKLQEETNLNNFPELGREEVIRAGDKLFSKYETETRN